MVTITQAQLKCDLECNGVVMVKANFEYPVVCGTTNRAARRINGYYRQIAQTLMKRARSELLPAAADEYKYAAENGYPFRPYETTMKFTVSYNDQDILSLYYDVYDYMGGAHGSTKRFGDTWRSSTGWFLCLTDFFPRGTNVKRLLTDNAILIADRQMAEGTHGYFEDYPKLIRKHFNRSKFYIVPEGVAIFYDQYAIGPYVEGIPVFVYETEIKVYP